MYQHEYRNVYIDIYIYIYIYIYIHIYICYVMLMPPCPGLGVEALRPPRLCVSVGETTKDCTNAATRDRTRLAASSNAFLPRVSSRVHSRRDQGTHRAGIRRPTAQVCVIGLTTRDFPSLCPPHSRRRGTASCRRALPMCVATIGSPPVRRYMA